MNGATATQTGVDEMIRETFKTHAEAKARASEIESKGAEFVSEYISGKHYVVDFEWKEEDASYSGIISHRWNDGKDTFVISTMGGKIVDYRKNGRSLPNRTVFVSGYMTAQFKARFH